MRRQRNPPLTEEEKQKSSDKVGASVGYSAGGIAALIALSIDDCASLKSLSASGATFNEVDEQGNGLIHIACETGDINMVNAIIAHYSDEPSYLDEPNWAGQSALFVACRMGDVRIVAKLLAAGCDPTRRDKTGFTTLHCSAFIGNLEISKMLMARGCDAFTYDKLQQSPANIVEKGWERPNEELSRFHALLKRMMDKQLKNKVISNIVFNKLLADDFTDLLRKYFARKTYVWLQVLEETILNESSSEEESDSEDSDSQDDGEEDVNEGGNMLSIQEETPESNDLIKPLSRPSSRPQTAERPKTGEGSRPGTGGSRPSTGKSEDAEGGRGTNSSPARLSKSFSIGSFSRSFSKRSFREEEEKAAADDEDNVNIILDEDGNPILGTEEIEPEEENDEDDVIYPDLMRSFESLRDEVRLNSKKIMKHLTSERAKFGVLRDLITPGWRESVEGGSERKGKKKKKDKAKQPVPQLSRKALLRKNLMSGSDNGGEKSETEAAEKVTETKEPASEDNRAKAEEK